MTLPLLLSGSLSLALALHSILTMSKRSVWPTLVLGLAGVGLVVAGVVVWVVA